VEAVLYPPDDGKLEMARREMEDAMVVMAHLESKAPARIKEHASDISRAGNERIR
jgi:hypothetical protein